MKEFFTRTHPDRTVRRQTGAVLPFLSIVLLLVGPGIGTEAGRVFGGPNGIIGSVSSVGNVALRGIRLSEEGTLFAGDRIETSGPSHARILLAGGGQLELGDDTDVRVSRDDSGVHVAMASGRMAFASSGPSAPVSVTVASYTIEAPFGAAAEVAFVAPNRLRVVALRESVSLRAQNGEGAQEEDDDAASDQLEPGEQRIINLDTGEPAEDPEAAAAVQDESDSSSTKWILIGAGAGGAAGTVVFLAGGDENTASSVQP